MPTKNQDEPITWQRDYGKFNRSFIWSQTCFRTKNEVHEMLKTKQICEFSKKATTLFFPHTAVISPRIMQIVVS